MPPLRTFTVSEICAISRQIYRWIKAHSGEFAKQKERIDLEEGARQIAEWLQWNASLLGDFQEHGRKFGCPPGANVFHFVLEDAKRYRNVERRPAPMLEKGGDAHS